MIQPVSAWDTIYGGSAPRLGDAYGEIANLQAWIAALYR
jgi:hypothetical protein